MIYTVKRLNHVQQNHSKEILLIHASQMASVEEISVVSVEWNFLFPLCFAERRLLVVKYAVNGFNAILSHTFDNTGNNEIGLLLHG